MKTTEYWCREIAKNFGKVIGEPTLDDAFFDRPENKLQLTGFVEVIAPIIKQIQLDAIKEGMRRAADILIKTEVEGRHPWCVREESHKAILTAAEQLTEKDL